MTNSETTLTADPEDLRTYIRAAADELATELGKPPTAWRIAARAVRNGAPDERIEDILIWAVVLTRCIEAADEFLKSVETDR